MIHISHVQERILLIMHKTTKELTSKLSSITSTRELRIFNTTLESKYQNTSFSTYISEQISASRLSPAELIQKAELQRNYGYQLLNGTRKPGRNKVISLALALKLPFSEVQRALTIAGEGSLYPKVKRDSIIIFAINKQFSVSDTNELLFKSGEDTL